MNETSFWLTIAKANRHSVEGRNENKPWILTAVILGCWALEGGVVLLAPLFLIYSWRQHFGQQSLGRYARAVTHLEMDPDFEDWDEVLKPMTREETKNYKCMEDLAYGR